MIGLKSLFPIFTANNLLLINQPNHIAQQEQINNIAEKLFKENISSLPNTTQLNTIISANNAQLNAIKAAQNGQSFVVQGPPGTGKSQTIINIIANNLAHGKKTAVISQKKQALQVVLQKLADKKLEHLCLMSFDGTEKKEIVADIKTCFEQAYNNTYPLQKIEEEKEKIAKKIDETEQELLAYHQALQQEGNQTYVPIFELLQETFSIANFNFEELKTYNSFSYNNWKSHGKAIEQFFNIEKENAQFYVQNILKSTFKTKAVEAAYNNEIATLLSIVDEILLKQNNKTPTFNNIEETYSFYKQFSTIPLYTETIFADLLHKESPAFETLKNENHQLISIEKEIAALKTKNKKWHTLPTTNELETLINRLEILSHKFFPYFSNEFLLIKIEFSKYYSGHIGFIPKAIRLLKQVKKQLDAELQLEEYNAELHIKYFNKNTRHLQQEYEIKHQNINKNLIDWYGSLQNDREKLINEAYISKQILLLKSLNSFVNFSAVKNISALKKVLLKLQNNYEEYENIFPVLHSLFQAEEAFQHYIFNAGSAVEIKQALLSNALAPHFKNIKSAFENTDIETLSKQLLTHNNEWLAINSIYTKAMQHHAFMQQYTLGLTSTAQIEVNQTAQYEKLKEQHKFLQNEFNKQQRFKPLEEIIAKTDLLLKELKPVGLFRTNVYEEIFSAYPHYYDTIIFDEASQIPLVEALPCMQNAKQIIIVGDVQQLPPTTFFATKEEQEEKNWSLLDAFQNILPNFHLNWHYRSIDERLIAFNNKAFYNNSLLSFPSNILQYSDTENVEISYANQAFQHYQKVYKKPLSYHYIKEAVYQNGTNTKEAKYIAELVKQLLLYNKQTSIGVVAFSIEQKNEIQKALNAIDFFDKKIDEVLEVQKYRYKNYEDFMVRNIESVQGDEKDIIIVSTTYGFDNEGKLNLNLGPLNKENGAKRLNVLFSRARKHMVVVSSLYYKQIESNNENIMVLKHYLQYAQYISLGNKIAFANNNITTAQQYLINNIQEKLTQKGYRIETNLGYSNFKCHLVVKEKEKYALSILIDDKLHYANNNIFENYVQNTCELQKRNWKVIKIYTLNWVVNPEEVLQKIENTLALSDIEPLLPTTELSLKFEKKEKELLFTKLLKQGKQSNFWEIAVDNSAVVILYGKVNNKGSKLIKQTKSIAEAITLKRKLIEEKIKKGYVRV